MAILIHELVLVAYVLLVFPDLIAINEIQRAIVEISLLIQRRIPQHKSLFKTHFPLARDQVNNIVFFSFK